MKNLLIKASLLVLVLGLMLPSFARAADTGADVYKGKCAMCHGPNGEGKGKMPALNTPAVQKKSDAELKAVIEKGAAGPPKMPAYGSSLSSAQIDDLVKFVRSLKK